MAAEQAKAEASSDVLESLLKVLRDKIAAMPPEAQDDIETFARSFRNQLAAGPPAHIALLLVAYEFSLEVSKALAKGAHR